MSSAARAGAIAARERRAAHCLAQAVLSGTAVAAAAVRLQLQCDSPSTPEQQGAARELLAAVEHWAAVCNVADRVLQAGNFATAPQTKDCR